MFTCKKVNNQFNISQSCFDDKRADLLSIVRSQVGKLCKRDAHEIKPHEIKKGRKFMCIFIVLCRSQEMFTVKAVIDLEQAKEKIGGVFLRSVNEPSH